MSSEMIQAIGNEHIGVVIRCVNTAAMSSIGVTTVIEFRPLGSLPLLHDTLSIRCMENKTPELHLAHSRDSRPGFKRQAPIGSVRIGQFNESHFRVEVRPNSPWFEFPSHPIRTIRQGSANVAVAAGLSKRLRSCHMRVHQPILEENQARIDASSLIEVVEHVAGPLINAHRNSIHAPITNAPPTSHAKLFASTTATGKSAKQTNVAMTNGLRPSRSAILALGM